MSIISNRKLFIRVIADTNDADYIEQETEIEIESLKIIKPIIEKIKNCKDEHNYPDHEYIDESVREKYNMTDNEYDVMSDIVPNGEYGIHTIEKIEIYEKINIITLL